MRREKRANSRGDSLWLKSQRDKKNASDIDLVLKGEELTIKDQIRLENDLDDLLLPWKFDVSVFHQITNSELLEHIMRVGIPVYNRDAELQKR